MLYPTPTHHFFFPHFISSSSFSPSPSPSPPSSSLSSQEMEGLMNKGGFATEMLVPKPEVSGEDLFVDQLLNLDNNENNLQEEGKNQNEPPVSVKQERFEVKDSTFLPLSPPPPETHGKTDDFGSVLSVVPAEEEHLEWLSQFVEESFSTPYPTRVGPVLPKPEPGSEPRKAHCFTTPPSKARRSKRSRTGCRVWSAGLSEPASSSSSTTTTTSSSYPSSPNPNLYPDPDPTPVKKQRKREIGSGTCGPPRRCSHCGVQKTPQWRAGPFGPKTLCNACGVRYKSGRLLPEYRPVCSPTFSSELHSNSHRKVMEMRRKKEGGQTESGLSHPVSSFG